MTRLYSVLTVKSLDEHAREIVGIASTGETDRQGDIVEPLGLKAPPAGVSLLWQHDHGKPVGWATCDQPTAKGITFRAKLPKPTEASPFRDLVEMAWGALVSQTVRGVSIGFRPLATEPMREGGIRFKSAELLEISLVSVPANASATVTSIKRYANAPRVVKLDRPVSRAVEIELDRQLTEKGGVDVMLAQTLGAAVKTTDDCLHQLDTRIAAIEAIMPTKALAEMTPDEFLAHRRALRRIGAAR